MMNQKHEKVITLISEDMKVLRINAYVYLVEDSKRVIELGIKRIAARIVEVFGVDSLRELMRDPLRHEIQV
jgi:hypothetical protein